MKQVLISFTVLIALLATPVVSAQVMSLTGSVMTLTNNALTPNNPVGAGIFSATSTRTGGVGSYGNFLSAYTVTAATPGSQFDSGLTSWVTHENLTGGQVFAGWFGSNTPAGYLSQTYSGGAAIGLEINVGNRWRNFMYQSDLGYTNYTVGLQIVPDVLPSADGINQVPVTISVASPAVVTLASHGFTANMGVSFGGTGTLPTGITAGTTYYILSAGLTPNTFEISSTLGGSPINTTGSFVAPIDALPSYPGDFAEAIGASVHGHQWWTGTLIRRDTIAAGGVAHQDYGGSVSVDAPAAWAQVSGDWVTGLDLSAGTYSSTYAIKLPDLTGILFGSTSSIYDNGGTMFVAAPTQVQGTLKATGSITGTFVRPIMTTLASLSSTVDPSPQAGDQAAISDAVACTANSPVTGGASTSCAVVYSGTQWKAVVSH